MSVRLGVKGQIQDRAIGAGILPKNDVYIFTTYRYVPWVNWTLLSNTGEGVQDYLGSVYIEGTNTFQIVNNTDSILYVSGGIPERNDVITGPEAVIGPFKGANVTLSSSSVTILARCYGYNFTTVRATRGFLDTRGKSAYVEVRGIRAGDNPPLPVLRSTWLRFYDMYDLIYGGNPLPVNQLTNTAWFSNVLDFSGAVSASLNVVGTATTVPTAGSGVYAYLSYTGVATGMGNWSAGGAIFTTVTGNNYVTNAPLTLAANKPALELFFLPGDMTGCQVNYIDLWIAAEVTS